MNGDVTADLVATVPSLAAMWQAEDADLPYVAMGHLADLLSRVADEEPATDFAPLFEAIERHLIAGDLAQRNLLIIGLLESIQNVDGDRAVRWAPLLGPSSQEAWNALNDLWQRRLAPERFNAMVARSRDIPQP